MIGLESQDIDIALDDMNGEPFARMIKQYLDDNGLESKGFGVIKANPDKSKHLETATINIHE